MKTAHWKYKWPDLFLQKVNLFLKLTFPLFLKMWTWSSSFRDLICALEHKSSYKLNLFPEVEKISFKFPFVPFNCSLAPQQTRDLQLISRLKWENHYCMKMFLSDQERLHCYYDGTLSARVITTVKREKNMWRTGRTWQHGYVTGLYFFIFVSTGMNKHTDRVCTCRFNLIFI